MRAFYLLILAVLLPGYCAADTLSAARFVPPGQRALSDWEFSVDGDNWTSVQVPHSYNAVDGHSPSYYRGRASYRTDIFVVDSRSHPYLLFEGAAQKCEVYVNGALAGSHRGGYTPFCVDLAGLVLPGRNQVKVICDNSQDLDLIPVSSDFNKNGGLHYPVWFYEARGMHFHPSAFGPYRVHVEQREVSDSVTVGVVRSYLCGRGTVHLKIKDAAGKTVFAHKLVASGEFEVPFRIPSPHLWNGVYDPYLYTVELCVGRDRAVTEVGFRYFRVTRDEGFFLNGKPYPLRGVSMHQDLDGRASAVRYCDIESDFEFIKELDCNFLRLAHYPHNDYTFRLCDRAGIVVQTEIPWVNVCGERATQAYFDNIHSQMGEMITALYNHPSIVFWGMWNELDAWGNTEALQGPLDTRAVVEQSARLYDYAKRLDSSRLVGLTDDSVFKRSGYTSLKADYYSENRYYGWYYTHGDFSGITTAMEMIRGMMGPCNISEYGVGVNPFCHTWKQEDVRRYPDDARHIEEYGNLSHESHAQQIARMPWLNFTSLWVLFDFPVANRKEGWRDSADGVHYVENPERLYMNDKGLVTRDRKTRKDAFYLYKAWWNHSEETVYIAGRRLSHRPAELEFTLTVYSNAPSLKLLQDGVEVASASSSGEPTEVIWKFPGLRIAPSGSSFTVISPSGRSDTVRFAAL